MEPWHGLQVKLLCIRQHGELEPYERFLVQLAAEFGSDFNVDQ